MPSYCFRREDGRVVERFLFNLEGTPVTITCEDGQVASRDYAAEGRHDDSTRMGWPMFSDAAGVHPNQVAEAKRQSGGLLEFDPDGRARFNSPQHRKASLKHIGMVDLEGYDG